MSPEKKNMTYVAELLIICIIFNQLIVFVFTKKRKNLLYLSLARQTTLYEIILI